MAEGHDPRRLILRLEPGGSFPVGEDNGAIGYFHALGQLMTGPPPVKQRSAAPRHQRGHVSDDPVRRIAPGNPHPVTGTNAVAFDQPGGGTACQRMDLSVCQRDIAVDKEGIVAVQVAIMAEHIRKRLRRMLEHRQLYAVALDDIPLENGTVGCKAIDYRRQLHLDRRDETLEAPDEFMLVVSFNPGYQRGLKELKPSTRQRFVALSFDYPEPEVEREILIGETGVGADHARRLVALAGKLRGLETLGLAERPSTRLLVNAARLLEAGSPPRAACDHAIVEALTDDPEVAGGLRDLVALVF